MSVSFSVPKFPSVKHSLHTELKQRVAKYFEENKIAPTGNWQLFLKAILMIAAFIAIYIHVVFFTPVWYWALLECFTLGGLIAGVGFNIMHDGSHGSFSKYKWVNKIAAHSVNIMGAAHFMWNVKHNMIHHSFTNIDGVDDDIETGMLMRLAPTQKKLKMHSIQHWYFWMLYALLYIFWVFFADYKKYFSKKIGAVPLKQMAWYDHAGFWLTKTAHALIFVVIPIWACGWLAWLTGFLVTTLLAGFVLSIVFQLAHTVEDAHFPLADEANKMEDEFAIHQIKTTANFATKNKLVSWLVGGLNFQIEHHLFPKISHVHYPAISQIVKDVCREYQLQYIEYPTMRRAVVAHVRFLREMGSR